MVAYGLLGTLALAGGGCLAVGAGLAGGAVAGYYYCKGRVSQNYDTCFADTWAGVHASLAELGLPIVAEEHDTTGGSVETRSADGDRVHIALEIQPGRPTERQATLVSVRVGTFGDQPLSDRILNQVDRHLMTPPRTVALPQTPPPSLAGLPGETAPPPLAGAPPTTPPPSATPSPSPARPTAPPPPVALPPETPPPPELPSKP
jgi:hypothetical protein